MARPCVATAVGGNPHVIGEDGANGFLVEYPDSATLADRIVSLLAEPALGARVGAAARERVIAGFSARSMVRQMENLYDRLLKEVRG